MRVDKKGLNKEVRKGIKFWREKADKWTEGGEVREQRGRKGKRGGHPKHESQDKSRLNRMKDSSWGLTIATGSS